MANQTKDRTGNPLRELMEITREAGKQLQDERAAWLADPQEDEASFMEYILELTHPQDIAWRITRERCRARPQGYKCHSASPSGSVTVNTTPCRCFPKIAVASREPATGNQTIVHPDLETARAYLAMLALQIPSIAQLHRQLTRNNTLRDACGIRQLPSCRTIRNSLRIMAQNTPDIRTYLQESMGIQEYGHLSPLQKDQAIAAQAAHSIIQYAQDNLQEGKPPVPEHQEILRKLAVRIFPDTAEPASTPAA